MIIGTRGSKLALIQTETALRKLKIRGDIRVIKTKGDKTKREITELGGRAFTRELDEALLSGRIDLAVHSLKDIPVEDFPEELEIACVVERGDPRDCLVSSQGKLEKGAVVGASSERRKAELLNMRDSLEIKSIRGNVPTRLEKLDNGEYDAIVTAKCALDRLGLSRATQVFSLSEMVPAAGQGAIAVVTRRDLEFTVPEELKLNLPPCQLERFFISGLGACRKPVGAHCSERDGVFELVGLFYKEGVRLTPTFEGSLEEIKKSISGWKEKCIFREKPNKIEGI